MYVHYIPRQLAWFYHGSWRIACTEMNTIFGATFVGHCMYNVCTLYVRAMKVSQWLTDVIANVGSWTRLGGNVGGEMFAWKRSVRFAHTAHDCRWRDNQTRAWSEEGRSSRDNIWVIVHMSDTRRAFAIFNLCNDWRDWAIWSWA